jgi:tetratricopeptide (TPR) repeat protein
MLLLWLLACLPHGEAQVHALADAAEVDDDALARLVKTLRASDDATWKAAYEELLAFGPDAVPELRAAVQANKPEAGRSLLVLAELGYAENFDLLEAAMGVPGLRPYAEAGWQLAEEALWLRLRARPGVALAEDYLEWFPDGPMWAQAEEIHWQETAWDALDALGKRPSDGQLLSILRDHADTQAAEEARRMLGDRALDEAERALASGRPEQALDLLERARELDPSLDTRPVEARARTALARSLATRQDTDRAIEELERALRLGSDSSTLLASLYLKRARRAFERLQPAQGMRDLARGEELNAALGPALSDLRMRQTELLLEQVRAGDRRRAAASEALVFAGEDVHRVLEPVVLERLAAGDVLPLEGVMTAARSEHSSPRLRKFGMLLLDQGLQNLNASVRARLANAEAVEAVLAPDDVFARQARSDRAELVDQLLTYERTVQLAREEVLAGGRILAPLPSTELLSDASLASVMGRQDPRQQELPFLRRVQLLRLAAQAPEAVASHCRQDPAAVGALLLELSAPPGDLVDWARVRGSLDAGLPPRIEVAGQPAQLTALRSGGVLELRVSVPGPPRRPDDAVLAQLLNLLFGGTTMYLFADPGLDGVEVILGMGNGQAWESLEERARLGISRESADRLNWPLILAEAPYSADHLAFVLDQQIH